MATSHARVMPRHKVPKFDYVVLQAEANCIMNFVGVKIGLGLHVPRA